MPFRFPSHLLRIEREMAERRRALTQHHSVGEHFGIEVLRFCPPPCSFTGRRRWCVAESEISRAAWLSPTCLTTLRKDEFR
jgi:hypothetical protein